MRKLAILILCCVSLYIGTLITQFTNFKKPNNSIRDIGDIILPYCLTEVNPANGMINLDECLEKIQLNIKNYDVKEHENAYVITLQPNTTTVKFNLYEYDKIAQFDESELSYIGELQGEAIFIIRKEIHCTGCRPPRYSELVSVKRIGNKVRVKSIYAEDCDTPYIRDAEIKDGVLHFSQALTRHGAWGSIKTGAGIKDKYKYADDLVGIGAESENNFCAEGEYQLTELILDSKGHYKTPAPSKIYLWPNSKGSPSRKELHKMGPIEVYDNGTCSERPFLETFLEYDEKDKSELTGNDFLEFFQSVKSKCDKANIRQAPN
jgi:hypothetical protein